MDQQQATRHLTGGAIPRPHMFMQSEESRAISNYFHNKLRGSGNCIPRLRTRNIQSNEISTGSRFDNIAVGRPVDHDLVIPSRDSRVKLANDLWNTQVRVLKMDRLRTNRIFVNQYEQFLRRVSMREQSYSQIQRDAIETLNGINTEIDERLIENF